MKSNRWRNLAALQLGLGLAAITVLSGCDATVTYVEPYRQPWYDVYGYYCGSGSPGPGCNFYADGSKIIDYEDPYYTTAYYNLEFADWWYTDSYGYSSEFYGWAWLSPDGILYDDYGRALNNTGESKSKDDLADMGELEQSVVTEAGKGLAEKYALAEDTGLRIAQTLNAWATLGKKRARTQKDIADFSKRLYGVNFESAVSAVKGMMAGDSAGIEQVNSQVAAYWSTSPETSKRILKSWYKKELGKAGQ